MAIDAARCILNAARSRHECGSKIVVLRVTSACVMRISTHATENCSPKRTQLLAKTRILRSRSTSLEPLEKKACEKASQQASNERDPKARIVE